MKRNIDIEAILTPLTGDNPAGEYLRYSPVYDEIQEARRADDMLDRGDWQHEIKTSDWEKVLTLSVQALSEKTKDLQIAAWLLEAMTYTEGFTGVNAGLTIITSFMQDFWEHLYPEIEDDDLEYRIGPLEFINDKLWLPIKQIPVTDSASTPGYSWMKWQESRQVGSEKDTLNQYGDVDDDKKRQRQELISEGKLTAEEFDAAVSASSKVFYVTLAEDVTACLARFAELDRVVDEKFGREAPRLAELKSSLEDCEQLVTRILKEKREREPDAVPEAEEAPSDAAAAAEDVPVQDVAPRQAGQAQSSPAAAGLAAAALPPGQYHVNRLLGSTGIEEAVWQDALAKLKSGGIKQALEHLLGASCSAQSIREKTNFRLLMARLCLKAERPDLARPIVEELHTLIGELQLERWESPIWLAEVLETLYMCLTAEGASDDDRYRARELLTRLCTLDVTKAMEYTLE
ncbi:MAG: type VI secretion system protein TssA [Proteobacteria bacterium]|nr:type VI secretion system protein TssA [Pseudomonadota bacterium]MBU4294363.1 type VI secretion system protein TssA [Pseudomonadota bacterium]MCG2749150.1 type VI secretion system protein TssA [Desulfobulbaceae bacterium]